MSGDNGKKFRNEEDLKVWLVRQGVDPPKAEKALNQSALTQLLENDYDMPSTLFGISFEELSSYPISLAKPIARHVHNKLQHKPVLPPDKPVVITLKYSQNKTEIHPWRKHLTLQALRESVITTWSDFEVAEFRLKFDGAILLEEESDIAKLTFPATIVVENMSKGFSDFKEGEAYRYAGVTNQVINADEFPTRVDIKVDNELFLHAKKDLTIKHRLFGALSEGCEYTRREFISSVLVLAASIAEVQLGVEELIAGRLGHGQVDWVALYKSYRICITEGKKDDLTKGVVQNIAQMAATGEDKSPKRRFSPSIPTYGIATTYTEWVFLKLTFGEPRALFRSTDRTIGISQDHLEDDLKHVAGQIVAIFNEQKVAVDHAVGASSPAKKPTLGEDKEDH